MQRFDTWYIQSILEKYEEKINMSLRRVEAEVDVPEKALKR